jgi:predicted acyl esterase
MSDGIRLSAKIWLPKNGNKKAVPAILEIRGLSSLPKSITDRIIVLCEQLHV